MASYKWVYALQIASIIFSGALNLEDYIPIYKRVLVVIESEKIKLIILSLLFIVSTLLQRNFQKIKNNTRITYQIGEEAVFEIALSSIGYIATILTISLNAYGFLLTAVIFFALGCIVDLTDRIYALPIFYLRGYHIFKSNEVKIITKMSQDQYRLRMDESPDGIEARELVNNTYIIL